MFDEHRSCAGGVVEEVLSPASLAAWQPGVVIDIPEQTVSDVYLAETSIGSLSSFIILLCRIV